MNIRALSGASKVCGQQQSINSHELGSQRFPRFLPGLSTGCKV